MCLGILQQIECWQETCRNVSTWTNCFHAPRLPSPQPTIFKFSAYDPIMPRRSSKNLCIHNIFSLRPQPTIPCSYPNCSRFFFNLSGHNSHMRTVHSSDGPLLDPSNPSPAPSPPQTRPNRSSPSSLIVPNPSPTSKHSDIDVAMPPSLLGIDYASSPSMDNAPSLSILEDDASSQASPHVDDTPSLSIQEDDVSSQASPHVDNAPSPTPSPGVNSLPLSPHPSLPDDSESTPSTEAPPWVWCIYHPHLNGEWFSIS